MQKNINQSLCHMTARAMHDVSTTTEANWVIYALLPHKVLRIHAILYCVFIPVLNNGYFLGFPSPFITIVIKRKLSEEPRKLFRVFLTSLEMQQKRYESLFLFAILGQ